ncbi:hypothetical protein DSO57_1034087 [Entomophthora muscae]|uniref:Uncharacterized protein n=1 Tax=Entomophthora muscae TaxID=34485 RepID=A0ACC2RQX9_9FUNG|nr:hypothetical protein DSO57_1034087 [Entomophthora muscae]
MLYAECTELQIEATALTPSAQDVGQTIHWSIGSYYATLASRFEELPSSSSTQSVNTALPTMMARVPDSYKGAIFHVALWAIHSSVIHSFDEKAAPTQIHQALLDHEFSWIATQAFFEKPRDKKCKFHSSGMGNHPRPYGRRHRLLCHHCSSRVVLCTPIPLSPPFPILPFPLTPTPPPQQGFSPALQFFLLPSTPSP